MKGEVVRWGRWGLYIGLDCIEWRGWRIRWWCNCVRTEQKDNYYGLFLFVADVLDLQTQRVASTCREEMGDGGAHGILRLRFSDQNPYLHCVAKYCTH